MGKKNKNKRIEGFEAGVRAGVKAGRSVGFYAGFKAGFKAGVEARERRSSEMTHGSLFFDVTDIEPTGSITII